MPCLNVGTPRKPNYLPAELCQICPGQRRLKLDERQVRFSVRHNLRQATHAFGNYLCSRFLAVPAHILWTWWCAWRRRQR